MNKNYLLLGIGALVYGVLIWFVDPFLLMMVSAMACIWGGLPALIIGGIFGWWLSAEGGRGTCLR